MTVYNAKHPYEPDWQIPRGVWANAICTVVKNHTKNSWKKPRWK